MKILLVHPDRSALMSLDGMLSAEGREIHPFTIIEEGVRHAASAHTPYDLAIVRPEGGWTDRCKAHEGLGMALRGGKVIWLRDDTSMSELRAQIETDAGIFIPV